MLRFDPGLTVRSIMIARASVRGLLAMGMVLGLLSIGARPISDNWAVPDVPVSVSQGPLLGAVTDTNVRIWARTSRSGRLSCSGQVAGRRLAVPGSRHTDLTVGHDLAGVVDVEGLAPGTSYDYRLALDGLTVGGGSFRTLPRAGQPAAFRFALGGDLSADFAPFKILDRLREQRPDFTMLLGDLIYADQPTPIPASLGCLPG